MNPSGEDSTGLGLGTNLPLSDQHRFCHEAMATVFEIICSHPDRDYARQGGAAAFDLVNRIESELSRFVANSDISRINHLGAGESVRVSPWTMECLQVAVQAHRETNGSFDVSMGTGLEGIELIPDELAVRTHGKGIRLDLGGIGKGYAIDRVAELLEEWGIEHAIVHGGFSSVLALEPPPGEAGWPLTLSVPGSGEAGILVRIQARRRALSGSGIRKRDHIVDPRTGRPVRDRQAAWVSIDLRGPEAVGSVAVQGFPERGGSPAAVAEALSTAFMILTVEEIGECCRRFPGLEAWVIPEAGGNDVMEVSLLHYSGSAG